LGSGFVKELSPTLMRFVRVVSVAFMLTDLDIAQSFDIGSVLAHGRREGWDWWLVRMTADLRVCGDGEIGVASQEIYADDG
jgi:hypothetical protein